MCACKARLDDHQPDITPGQSARHNGVVTETASSDARAETKKCAAKKKK
jgi:hypothetical protein